ncbi:ATP-grasp domain-containing protein [Polyangium spumosum]|uniref:ATP-grasp domain-containing protein n=1 Tax=Polyangium spumosum TaxID=889282 RepID=A0A6N7PXB1_9BACT|nr:ATP-grasp domain-containing protein [Polyangium spumosum]
MTSRPGWGKGAAVINTDHDPTRPASLPPLPTTILCVSSYFKGHDFLEQARREGCRVILLTLESLLDKPWPREVIDEVFGMSTLNDRRAVVNAVSYLARTREIERVAPLDDYDVELAAHLREHLRIPGMGETTARYFRDKLAMRARAKDRSIPVPDFVHVLNDERVRRFLRTVPAPWLLKPRSEAASLGIKKLEREDEALRVIEELGDDRSRYLLERMIPGQFFHVDSIVSEKRIVFAEAHQYRTSLFEVVNQGGPSATQTVDRSSDLWRELIDVNDRVIEHMGLVRGVTHIEYVRSAEDGRIYFIEAAARVGGSHTADVVEAATGINLWREWAKIEITQGERPYELPPRRHDYAGLVLSLSRQEHPDMSAYTDPEIVWRTPEKTYHAGLIVRADEPSRVRELVEEYAVRFVRDFTAVLPPPTSPTA